MSLRTGLAITCILLPACSRESTAPSIAASAIVVDASEEQLSPVTSPTTEGHLSPVTTYTSGVPRAFQVADLIGLPVAEAQAAAVERGWIEVDVFETEDDEMFMAADLKPDIRIRLWTTKGIVVDAVAG